MVNTSGEHLRILTAADLEANPNSGSAGTVHYTNQSLRALGHQVDELWAHDLPARRIAHGNLHALIEQPRALQQAVLARCAKHRYDVVQISQPQGFAAASGLRRSGFRGILVNRSHGVELRVDEVVGRWHRQLNVPISRLPWATEWLNRLQARHWRGVRQSFDGVVVGSSLDRDYLVDEEAFAPDRVRAIAHGVEPSFLQLPLASRGDSAGKRILHVGQYAFIKGSSLLPTIVNRVLAQEGGASFTWVCAAAAHAQIMASFPPSMQQRVNLVDSMPIERLREIYDAHDVFVFPSLFEGFGKAAVEAMARGLCVVASDEGGMRDCIRHGESGWLCPPGDVQAFVGRLLGCLSNVEESVTIGRVASQVAQSCSWESCARNMVEFYRSLEENARHGGSAS